MLLFLFFNSMTSVMLGGQMVTGRPFWFVSGRRDDDDFTVLQTGQLYIDGMSEDV